MGKCRFSQSGSIDGNGSRIKEVKNAIGKLFDYAIMFVAFFISFNPLLSEGTAIKQNVKLKYKTKFLKN